MASHVLKLWPRYFAALLSGVRPFDVRFNDREYAVGDRITFREFDPDEPEGARFTGRECVREVTAITDQHLALPHPEFLDQIRPIRAGWVVLGLSRPEVVLTANGGQSVAATLLAALSRAAGGSLLVPQADLEALQAETGPDRGWTLVVTNEHPDGLRVNFKRAEVKTILAVPPGQSGGN